VADKRTKGGRLWVYGSQTELAPAMASLEKNGLTFKFAEKRNGWYLRER
jgi:hypothetical protein